MTPKLRSELSEQEFRMFTLLGFDYIMDVFSANDVYDLYKIAADKCFTENLTGPAVESLRRTYTAFKKMNPYRKSPEFDALIRLEE